MDIKVTDKCKRNIEKYPDIDNIEIHNIDIKNTQFDIKSVKKSPIETPKYCGFTDEISRVNNMVSRVVRSPVPRNRYSPQSDSKKGKTSQRKKIEGKIRKTDNLKSQPSITEFLGMKNDDKK